MELLTQHINSNKPLFIKNFLLRYDFDRENLLNELLNTNSANKHYYSNGVYDKKLDNYEFIKNIKNDINHEDNYVYTDNIRYWIHKKNNLTIYHYDGDGTNVINLCIKGKKKFVLTAPNSHLNFSFSNISLFNLSKINHEYILEENDLLLIPSFWYHTVLCMENNTVTFNICFIDKKSIIPDKQKLKYYFHKYLNTSMNKSEIINIAMEQKYNIFSFAEQYTIELISLILIFIFLETIGKKIFLNEFIIIIALIFTYEYTNKFSGIPLLILFNYLLIFLIYKIFFS